MTEITRDSTNTAYRFQQTYTLDNETFNIELAWNPINSSWYMTLKDIDSNIILPSIRLVSKIFMLRNKRAVAGIPKGDFKITQKQQNFNNKVIDFDNLGFEFILNYYDESEVVY